MMCHVSLASVHLWENKIENGKYLNGRGYILFRHPLNCRREVCLMYHLWLNEPSLIILSIIFPYILYFISNIHVINTFATFSDVSIAVDPKAAPWNMLYVYVMLKNTANFYNKILFLFPAIFLFTLCSSKIQNIRNKFCCLCNQLVC